MFPAGTAGAALFLLRLLVAADLVWEGTAHWALVSSNWIAVAFVMPAIFLCFGLMTTATAVVGCVIQLVATYELGGRHSFHLAISILSSVIVAALGPGAYSIDSRLFGRKTLKIPPRR